MLDLTTLRKRCSEGEEFEFLLFWGHKPSKDGRITQTCLSQWYESPFTIDDVFYPTAEHWMMAAKARLFRDDETLAEILDASDPHEAKSLGRKVKSFDDKIWKKDARRLVTEGNIAKFSQNESIKTFLLSTGNAVLTEASPYDRIWGIGMAATDEGAKNPHAWQGQNLLGFALMDVRTAISKIKQLHSS